MGQSTNLDHSVRRNESGISNQKDYCYYVIMLWDPDRENDIFASETATYSYEVRGNALYIEYSKFGLKRTDARP